MPNGMKEGRFLLPLEDTSHACNKPRKEGKEHLLWECPECGKWYVLLKKYVKMEGYRTLKEWKKGWYEVSRFSLSHREYRKRIKSHA